MPETTELTTIHQILERIDARTAILEEEILRSERREEQFTRLLEIVRARTFVTHLTIEEVAIVLGVSPKTVRRRIRVGDYTLEKMPGTQVSGIPVEQVFVWIPVRRLRAAAQREKKTA